MKSLLLMALVAGCGSVTPSMAVDGAVDGSKTSSDGAVAEDSAPNADVAATDTVGGVDVLAEVGGTTHQLLNDMSLTTSDNGFTEFKFSVPAASVVTYAVRNRTPARINAAIVPKSQWDVFGMYTVASNGNVIYTPYQAYADHQDAACPVSDSVAVAAGEYALGIACRGDCMISADLSARY